MNRLLLMPGHYTYWTRTDGSRTVPVYIVSEEGGRSLVVFREDAPGIQWWAGGGYIEVRAGFYGEVSNEDVKVDLAAVAAGVLV